MRYGRRSNCSGRHYGVKVLEAREDRDGDALDVEDDFGGAFEERPALDDDNDDFAPPSQT